VIIVASLLMALIVTATLNKIYVESEPEISRAANEAAPDPSITMEDVKQVKEYTRDFFLTFEEGKSIKEKLYNELTFQYFSKDFLENQFPADKSALFFKYRWNFVSETTGLNEQQKPTVIKTGAVKSFEIEEIQKDNVNQTITAYVRMDLLNPNQRHWIEWRNIPGEGWKINALSFVGSIESLNQPLSPKKY
ncbi:hypothetical protein, partial [Cryptosporangium minutisporangium]